MNPKKATRNRKVILTGVASLSLLAGCGGDAKRWKKAPGTKGMINLDAVKQAFQRDQSVHNFENRVNEIFEGDNLIVFSSRKEGNGFKLSAYEDLDKDKKATQKDDLLFTLTVKDGRCYLKGYGANSYYDQTWRYGHVSYSTRRYSSYYYRSRPSFFMWYGGYNRWSGSYHTPTSQYDSINRHRSSYRSTPAFRQQVTKNSVYDKSMAKKLGSKYSTATRAVSTKRENYIKKTSSSRSFNKTLSSSRSRSGWGVRSSGSRSSGSRGGWGGRSSGGIGC